MFKTEILASTISDNFFYLIHNDFYAIAIDPIDPVILLDSLKKLNLKLELIILTHFHWDHINGSQALLDTYPQCRVLSSKIDGTKIFSNSGIAPTYQIQGESTLLLTADTIELATTEQKLNLSKGEILHLLETPGHTTGHISVYHKPSPMDARESSESIWDKGTLWCGDSIFHGGAGNCNYGGDPKLLFRTFKEVFFKLEESTVLYPGHDYSLNNLLFCKEIMPDSIIVEEKLEQAKKKEGNLGKKLGKDQKHRELTHTTIGMEKTYNPFFQCNQTLLQERVSKVYGKVWSQFDNTSNSVEEQTFLTLRRLRDHWNGQQLNW